MFIMQYFLLDKNIRCKHMRAYTRCVTRMSKCLGPYVCSVLCIVTHKPKKMSNSMRFVVYLHAFCLNKFIKLCFIYINKEKEITLLQPRFGKTGGGSWHIPSRKFHKWCNLVSSEVLQKRLL